MEITINPLDPESVARALDLLEAYRDSLAEKQETLLRTALKDASETANQIYAQHPGDHGIASTVYEVSGTEGVLIATAPDKEIGFIEFGTGIRHPEWPGPSVGMDPDPYGHGSYGKQQGKDPGYWHYGGNVGNKDRGWEWNRGNITDGRDPAAAMVWGRQVLIESVLDNARGIFQS